MALHGDCAEISKDGRKLIEINIPKHELVSVIHETDGDSSAIQMEVVADFYQQQKQRKQSTRTQPRSNAERQRRYREKRKADKINACTSSIPSSDVPSQKELPQNDVQVNKRQPLSSAERQRKYRKLLRERRQQQQMENINAITSSIHRLQNVDPAELARKRLLNKQRQSRFRARQRLEWSRTSAHQAQPERPNSCIQNYGSKPPFVEAPYVADTPLTSFCIKQEVKEEPEESVYNDDEYLTDFDSASDVRGHQIHNNRLPPNILIKAEPEVCSIEFNLDPNTVYIKPGLPNTSLRGSDADCPNSQNELCGLEEENRSAADAKVLSGSIARDCWPSLVIAPVSWKN